MEVKYKMICDENWTEVEKQVNEAMGHSFRPVGAPFVFTQKDDKGEDQQLICQAMMHVVYFPKLKTS